MKRFLAFFVLCLWFFSLSACAPGAVPQNTSTGQPLRLYITVSWWNGWDSEYSSPDEEYVFDIVKGQEYELPCLHPSSLSFRITKIEETQITIKTNAPMVLLGTSFKDATETFTIPSGATTYFSTPIYDAGTGYLCELK